MAIRPGARRPTTTARGSRPQAASSPAGKAPVQRLLGRGLSFTGPWRAAQLAATETEAVDTGEKNGNPVKAEEHEGRLAVTFEMAPTDLQFG